MNISIIAVIFLCFVHWVGDFVMQNDWMASNKSKNNYALSAHVFTYCAVFLFVLMANGNNGLTIIEFVGINGIIHWAVDYVTSRINAKLWANNQIHNFFVSVGFDQFIHLTTLFITYNILFK